MHQEGGYPNSREKEAPANRTHMDLALNISLSGCSFVSFQTSFVINQQLFFWVLIATQQIIKPEEGVMGHCDLLPGQKEAVGKLGNHYL